MPQPNILWICTDQQRFDTLGCYGNEFVRTPNLDRLAQGGVLFEHAYSQSPICTPSRACFLTGRYPRTTRARQNGQDIPPDEMLVTKLLSDAGYVCGLSGKLHLSTCNPQVCPGTERRIEDGYDNFHWSHHPRPDWPTSGYGQWLKEVGVDYHTEPHEGCKYILAGMPAQHHQTTWCADKAIHFIEANTAFDRPWLFSYNCFDPHNPFDPPTEYLERYLGFLDEIPLPNYVEGELDCKPYFQHPEGRRSYSQGSNLDPDEMTDGDHRLIRAAYFAMVDLIDAQVGRILEALERTEQLSSTLVIFTSDHGEMLGDHNLYLKGPYFYEPAVRVPLIVSLPGAVGPARRSRALVELGDLTPTVLDVAGLPRHPGMQARSLWPLLTGESGLHAHREDVYCEYYSGMPPRGGQPGAYATMLRTARHKMVAIHAKEPGELYDLENDPTETKNLWDDSGSRTLKLEMLKRLADRMAWTVDPLPPRRASF